MWNLPLLSLSYIAFQDRAVLYPELDILIIISKSASEDSESSDVLGAFRNRHAEINFVSVIQMELVDRHIGNLCIVNKNAVVIDG